MKLNIPSPNIHSEVAVNQHLVPRCYMKEWSYNDKSVWVYDKENQYNESCPSESNWSINSIKTKKINSINNFHDLKAGSVYLPKEALTEIFGFLLNFKIILNGKKLDTLEKLHRNYFDFDNWQIEFLNGGIIDKTDRDKIEIYLKETRYTYIETEWAKRYESNWRTYIKNIEKKLRNLKQSIFTGITVNDIQLIIEYLIMYNFRSSEGNEIFNEVFKDISNILPELDSIKIPEEERIHSEDDTALEEIKHNLLLNQFVEFLKSNKGYMKNFVDRCVRNLEINFCLTDSCYPFITSNTPAFILNRDDGAKEYILVALPTMLISLGRGNSQQFIVSNLSNKEVDVYNRKIAKHGTLLIVPDKDYDISTLLCI